MPERIFKADTVILSASSRAVCRTRIEAEQQPERQQEAQTIAAEAQLLACRILNDAREQARTILSQSKQEAEARRLAAGEEAAAIRQQAEKAGYDEGFRNGCEQGRQSLEGERRQLAADQELGRKQLQQERSQMVKDLEPEMVQLAMSIARRVLHAELKLHPEQVSRIARGVLYKVVDLKDVVLKVNAGDYNAVLDTCRQEQASGLRVEIDESLSRGDCQAETPYGTVDGTIEGQLGEIRQRLTETAANG
jgi:flagellar assembly protein FliH